MARPNKNIMAMLEQASGHLPNAARTLEEIADAPPEERPDHLAHLEAREVELEAAFFEFLRRVSGTFITPFDRQDLVALAKELDDVLGGVHQTADLMVRLQVGELPAAVKDLVADVAKMVVVAGQCVLLLKKPDKLSAVWQEVATVSNRAISDYNRALAEIFDMDEDPRLLVKHKLVADQTFQVQAAVQRYVTACGITAIKET